MLFSTLRRIRIATTPRGCLGSQCGCHQSRLSWRNHGVSGWMVGSYGEARLAWIFGMVVGDLMSRLVDSFHCSFRNGSRGESTKLSWHVRHHVLPSGKFDFKVWSMNLRTLRYCHRSQQNLNQASTTKYQYVNVFLVYTSGDLLAWFGHYNKHAKQPSNRDCINTVSVFILV
jgi:hypothetical protein